VRLKELSSRWGRAGHNCGRRCALSAARRCCSKGDRINALHASVRRRDGEPDHTCPGADRHAAGAEPVPTYPPPGTPVPSYVPPSSTPPAGANYSTGARPGNEIGTGMSLPIGNSASNPAI